VAPPLAAAARAASGAPGARPLESSRSACLRIAIDARKLHDFGIGTYVRNLIGHLALQDDETRYVLLCRPEDAVLCRSFGPRFEALVERAANYSVREQLALPMALRRARVDLFHAPHYVVSPLTTVPYVVTIHDCIHLRFPQYLPSQAAHVYARVMMRMSARRARRVLTVSQASKEDILHFLRVPAAKVEVIHNAIDAGIAAPPSEEAIARVCQRFQLTSSYILYAGNIKPHKNVDRLIEAYSILRRRGYEQVKLLIIGDEISRYQNLRRLVHRFQLHQHVRFFGFVPEATLAVLYRKAAMFVFPSLYEGFGLPPLEAMAAGTPVITSKVSSLPEVVGDAALLVDPMDAGAIADAMARVLDDEALRRDLIRRGCERARMFSWTRSVARIREVYGEVLASAPRR
jgi:glycosyltransferase involved in cell wall biosynthesis